MTRIPENPLSAAHEAAKQALAETAYVAQKARMAESEAAKALHMVAYALIVSIPCTYEPCSAKVGEPCSNPCSPSATNPNGRVRLGLRAQHGMRADLAGANGEYSYEMALVFQRQQAAKKEASQNG
jgi:hypothetical protein